MEDIKSKLHSEIDETDWSMLRPHYDRGAVFIISESLDLAEVGEALATDKVDAVKAWQTSKSLGPLDEEIANKFDKDPHTKIARFLIIQPYVIIQLLPDINQ